MAPGSCFLPGYYTADCTSRDRSRPGMKLKVDLPFLAHKESSEPGPRAGIPAILVDPCPVYPPDFRVEKLPAASNSSAFAGPALRRRCHGLRRMTPRTGSRGSAICATRSRGIRYDGLVNAIRREIPPAVESIIAKAVSISTSGAAKNRLVERRGDFRAPGGARQRIRCRAAPRARHRAPDHQRPSFNFARIQSGSGRPRGLGFCGPNPLP